MSASIRQGYLAQFGDDPGSRIRPSQSRYLLLLVIPLLLAMMVIMMPRLPKHPCWLSG